MQLYLYNFTCIVLLQDICFDKYRSPIVLYHIAGSLVTIVWACHLNLQVIHIYQNKANPQLLQKYLTQVNARISFPMWLKFEIAQRLKSKTPCTITFSLAYRTGELSRFHQRFYVLGCIAQYSYQVIITSNSLLLYGLKQYSYGAVSEYFTQKPTRAVTMLNWLITNGKLEDLSYLSKLQVWTMLITVVIGCKHNSLNTTLQNKPLTSPGSRTYSSELLVAYSCCSIPFRWRIAILCSHLIDLLFSSRALPRLFSSTSTSQRTFSTNQFLQFLQICSSQSS